MSGGEEVLLFEEGEIFCGCAEVVDGFVTEGREGVEEEVTTTWR